MTTCAQKTRKDGYWHSGVMIVNGLPIPNTTFITDTSSTLCRHDQRMITPECKTCDQPSDVVYLENVGLWIEGVSHGANK